MPWPPVEEAFGHDERERFRITAARHVGRGGSRGLTLTVSPATTMSVLRGPGSSGQSDNGVAIRFRQGASGATA